MSRILVVEDNPSNMKLATTILSHAGHEVLEAWDAAEGLAIAASQQLDLILVDIQMPSTDGFSVLRSLRERPATASIPVVALTALAMTGDRERILAAGFDGYIPKPVRYRTLLDTVQAVSDRTGGAVD